MLQPLKCDEAALTGESMPAKKENGDIAFMGGTVAESNADAVVFDHGKREEKGAREECGAGGGGR